MKKSRILFYQESKNVKIIFFLTFLASIATQQSISNKIVNPGCPQGYIKFAHRCVREQPEKCPIGMINISFFNYTTVE